MKVRRLTAGIAAMATSGLLLSGVAPASAEPQSTPSATAIVGVGSDTIEGVVQHLADAWNATSPAFQLASFDATGTSPITLRAGGFGGSSDPLSITRPNGSGQGKGALFGTGNNANINYARSSSSLSGGEVAALTQFAVAVDGLKMAVSGSVASHAPASLSIADLVKIYGGQITKWNQIPGNAGGSSATIKPYLPQTGSGTRSFFVSELKAGNGGVDVVLAGAVGSVQEHDPAQIQSDPDAIVPFSTARAVTLANPSAIRLEDGYRARRAVYNVVRNADKDSAWSTALFGTGGYLCSAAAKTVIEADGFEQLAATSEGGVCGQPLTATPANLNSAGAKVTSTALAMTSPVGGSARLVADVSATSGVPDGDVDFYEGTTKLGTGLLSGGRATFEATGLSTGSHTFTARFVSAETKSFTDSASAGVSGVVRAGSQTTAVVTVSSYGQPGSARVSVASEGSPATGSVTVTVGAWQQTVTLSSGAATVALPGTLAAGAKSLVASYQGTATVAPSTATQAFAVGRAGVSLRESFAAKVKKGKRVKGAVTVSLTPVSGVLPAGKVVVKDGKKVVGSATVVNGKATIKLKKLGKKGKHKLVATYSGTADVDGATLAFTVKQK